MKVLIISSDNPKRLGELKTVAAGLCADHEAIVITDKNNVAGSWNKAWVTTESIGANLIGSVLKLAKDADYIISSGNIGLSILPGLAFQLSASLATEVTDIQKENDHIIFTHPVYGGKAIAKYKSNKEKVCISLRENYFDPDPLDGQTEAENLTVLDKKIELLKTEMEETEGISLEDASVIISGGRGIGGKEGFVDLSKLAKLFEGAIGASRAAVDAGWIPNNLQVGQTGTIVAPDLYVAVGISGASQHLAGITNAKIVVAVNKDEEAPIFKRARYGIVADWKKFIPLFIEKVGQLK